MTKLIPTCPICHDNIIVTRFYSPTCLTSFEGSFELEPDPFSSLTEEQRNFVLTFIRAEGRLNKMEEILGLSYPTLKNRLNEVIRVLGFEPEKETPRSITAIERARVLEFLEAGKITSSQALRYLHGEEPITNLGGENE